MIKKGISIAIILLFIALAVAPAINANVVESEMVELEVEFCGLGKKHTVQLTQQEADEIELLFDDIDLQLRNSKSRIEANEIITTGVVELDKYGLLGEIGLDTALKSFDIQNRFTLIAGKITNAIFIGPIALSVLTIFLVHLIITLGVAYEDTNPNLMIFLEILLTFYSFFIVTLTVGNYFNPMPIVNIIFLGLFEPSQGHISSYAISSKSSIDGKFSGFATGFTGLKISFIKGTYFLGFAMRFNVDEVN